MVRARRLAIIAGAVVACTVRAAKSQTDLTGVSRSLDAFMPAELQSTRVPGAVVALV